MTTETAIGPVDHTVYRDYYDVDHDIRPTGYRVKFTAQPTINRIAYHVQAEWKLSEHNPDYVFCEGTYFHRADNKPPTDNARGAVHDALRQLAQTLLTDPELQRQADQHRATERAAYYRRKSAELIEQADRWEQWGKQR